MSRENYSFRDYCEAENSDDEDYIKDLQSRLYAEIYYQDVNSDKNIQDRFSSTRVNNSVSYKSTPKKNNCEPDNENSRIFVQEENDIKSNTIESSKNCYQCENSNKTQAVTNSELDKERRFVEKIEDVKLVSNSVSDQKLIITNVFPCQLKDKVITQKLNTDNKTNKVLSNVKSVSCSVKINETQIDKVFLNSSGTANQSNDLHVKLKKSLDATVSTEVTNQPASDIQHIVNKTVPKISVEDQLEKDRCKNLLRTYEFAKQFINKLYFEKYKELQEKLNALEAEANDQSDDDVIVLSVGHIETDTRYNILDKHKKEKEAVIDSEEVMMISDDSDSEASILEVPVPPKPNPPLINLQDSDDDSVILNFNNDSVEQICAESNVTNEEDTNSQNITWMIDKENWWDSQDSDHSERNTELPEDIVLNCVIDGAEKNTSNPKESSTSAQLEQNDDSKSSAKEKEEDAREDETVDKNPDNTPSNENDVENIENIEEVINIREQNNTDESAHSNSVQHKKKNQCTKSTEMDLDFADDKIIEISISHPETSKQSKKRSYEYVTDEDANDEQVRYISNEGESHEVIDKERNEQSWTEYFFRPMSNKLRAFYTESRGQENFDLNEIQSKMSKDPRLWTILEEDVTARHRKRLRFWHLKCSNCQSDGHQRHNCPMPRRPLRCHMCGIEGHIEPRCPEKMCLTCGKKQGTFRKTCESCRTLYCSMCNAVGHKSVECPDLWRRFHHTTKQSDVKVPENLAAVMKHGNQLACCNCTKRGHDSSSCKEYRWSPHFPTPAFVSNYKDGPRYTDETTNIIPEKFTKETAKSNKNETNKSRNQLILYTCGMCISGTNVHEVKYNISMIQYTHVDGLIEGRVKPTFLQKLLKIFEFEVKIYKDLFGELILFIKTLKENANLLRKIIIHWMKLNDNEKDQGIIILPHETAELIPMLKSDLQDLDKPCPKTPSELWGEIKYMRKQLKEAKASGKPVVIRKRLLRFQSKLLAMIDNEYHGGASINYIRKQTVFKTGSEKFINSRSYLHLLLLYNTIFAPHIPSNKLHEIECYISEMKLKQNKRNSTESRKQKKNIKDSYIEFINQLKSHNERENQKRHQEISVSASNTSKKHLSAPVESVSRNNQRNNIEVIPVTNNIRERISESNNINTTESAETSAQSSHTNEISDVPNTKKTEPQSITSSNLIEIIPQSSTTNAINAHEGQSTTGNIYFLDLQGTLQSTTGVKEVEEKNDNIESSGGNGQVVENKEGNTAENQKTKTKSKINTSSDKEHKKHLALINNAKNVIDEALKYHVPYLTKAANEVKRKLENNDIQKRHVNMLRKIVKHEKAQRKAINSFYSVL